MADSAVPRISLNKLGEYITTTRPRRRHVILQQQKFPPAFLTTLYKESQEVIQQFSSDKAKGVSWLRDRAAAISARPAAKPIQKRNLTLNANALKAYADFIEKLNDPRFKALQLAMAPNSSPLMVIGGVRISVRPELTSAMDLPKKAGEASGGIKLHFPLTHPLTVEAGAYIGAVLARHCEKHGGKPSDYRACAVVDVPQKRVHWAPKATVTRFLEIEAACEEIAARWPSVKPPSSAEEDGDGDDPFGF